MWSGDEGRGDETRRDEMRGDEGSRGEYSGAERNEINGELNVSCEQDREGSQAAGEQVLSVTLECAQNSSTRYEAEACGRGGWHSELHETPGYEQVIHLLPSPASAPSHGKAPPHSSPRLLRLTVRAAQIASPGPATLYWILPCANDPRCLCMTMS